MKDWTIGTLSLRYRAPDARAGKLGARHALSARIDALIGAAIALLAFWLYTTTLLPGLGSRDTAELQWVVPTLGLAHPTGYPLYTLLGWLWNQLPLGGTPAWRLNLFSAAAAALCAGVVYQVGRAIGQRPALAAAAALALAASLAFWSQATIAEVYALAALLQALLLLALLRCRAGRWPLWPAGLMLGLALAHHRMIILMIPGLLLFIILSHIRPKIEDRRLRIEERMPPAIIHPQSSIARSSPVLWKGVVFAFAALLAGCLLYLYVPLRAPGWMRTWGQVWDHISGAALSGQFFDPARLRAEGGARLVDLARRFVVPQFTVVGALLALAGALRLARRDAALAVLLGVSYLAVVTFCAAYYVADVEVFFIPAHLLAALLIGEGAKFVMELIDRGLHQADALQIQERTTATRLELVGSRFLALRSHAAWALLMLPVFLLYRNFEPVRALNTPEAEMTARQIMAQSLPPGALIVGDWYATEGPRYLQLVEGLRPDLQLVSAVSRSAIREALHHGRAVYLTAPDLSLGFAQAPAGLLWQVVDAPLAAVTSTHLQWDAGMALTGYTLPAGPYAPGTPVPVTLQWEAKAAPSAAYTLFVHLVAEDGTIWGQHDAPPASAPTDRWRAGDRLLELCLPALKPDAPPGRYRVTLGWYEYPSLRRPNLVRFGQPTAPSNYVTLGTIEVAAR